MHYGFSYVRAPFTNKNFLSTSNLSELFEKSFVAFPPVNL